MNSYFNTTQEPDPTLFEVKARTQEQIILEIFRKYPDLTASEVHKLYPDFRVPITSIRRAITNLATDGYQNMQTGEYFRTVMNYEQTFEKFPFSVIISPAKLRKLSIKRTGAYGRPEYAYEIINK